MLFEEAIEILNKFKSISLIEEYQDRYKIDDTYMLRLYPRLSDIGATHIYSVDIIKITKEIRHKEYAIEDAWELLPDAFREEACYHLDWMTIYSSY